MVKTEQTDLDGNTFVERTLFEYDEEGNATLETYYVLDDEFLAKHNVNVR